MTWLSFVVASLAVYRLSTDLAIKAGPFHLFQRGRLLLIRLGLPAQGVTCPVCISFWLSVPAAWWAGGDGVGWLGIAGLAALLWRVAVVIEAS